MTGPDRAPFVDLDGPTRTYVAADFEPHEEQVCDLIMKGGLTSGAVYPHAVCELASAYRLENIGGTSAGALAAALAAAAEYHRRCLRRGDAVPTDAGYVRIGRLPEYFARGQNLFRLFQPVSVLRAHFDAALAALKAARQPGLARPARLAWSLLRHFPLPSLAGAMVVLLPLGLLLSGYSGAVLAAVTALLVGVGAALGVSLGAAATYAGWSLYRRLPGVRFGICNGHAKAHPPSAGGEELPVTDWLHAEIQAVAGLAPGAPPLRFGDIDSVGVHLSVITTDLSQCRPFELSLAHDADRSDDDHLRAYYFDAQEFAELFPAEVVDALLAGSRKLGGQLAGGTLHKWPDMRDVPLVVAARLSFGVPLLLQAVPLYRYDPTLADEQARAQLRRCWLSDGGISSNLPIHFFDGPFPDRPTFAISLENHSPERHGTAAQGRVAMYTGGPEDTTDPLNPGSRRRGVPVEAIASLPDFIAGVVNAAKDWQDVVQSIQAGYRDRIVHVALKSQSEGGLNLNMSEQAVQRLSNLGRMAGRRLLDFELAPHRWRRFLSVTDMIEREFAIVKYRWNAPHGPGQQSFREFARAHAEQERHFKPPAVADDPAWLEDATRFYDAIAALGLEQPSDFLSERANTPRPRTDLKARPRL